MPTVTQEHLQRWVQCITTVEEIQSVLPDSEFCMKYQGEEGLGLTQLGKME